MKIKFKVRSFDFVKDIIESYEDEDILNDFLNKFEVDKEIKYEDYFDLMQYEIDCDIYQQAQSKVIFKGWFVAENQDTQPTDVKTITNGKIHLFWFNNIQGWYLSRGIHTLEDLVKFNLEMV